MTRLLIQAFTEEGLLYRVACHARKTKAESQESRAALWRGEGEGQSCRCSSPKPTAPNGTTPDQEVPVLVLDVTEQEADKLLLSLDPLAELAETNAQALDGLLRDVQTGSEGLAGMRESLARENGLLPEDKAEVTEFELKAAPPVRAFLRLACARLSQARTGDLQKECCTNSRFGEGVILSTANDTRPED